MKKLLVSLAAFALATSVSFAEWKTVGTVQIADTPALMQAVAKVGEFTGNQMIGMMVAQQLGQLPGSQVFGPARPGAATLIPLFVENGEGENGILYPTALAKDAFLKKYPGAVESNGLIRAEVPSKDDPDEKEVWFVAYSADGQWAGASDKPQQARLALKEIDLAKKSLKGDLVKVRVNRAGIDEICKGVNAEDDKDLKALVDLVGQIDGFMTSLKVSDAGVDFKLLVKPAKESEIAKIGLVPLAADPLAFADKSVLVADAYTANCGKQAPGPAFAKVRKFVEDLGLPLDFLTLTEKDGKAKFELDLDKCLATVKAHTNDLAKIGKEEGGKKLEEFKALFANTTFKAEGPAGGSSIAIKGYSCCATPAERFAKTLPEAAEHKPFYIGFGSLYSFIKAIQPTVMKEIPAEQQQMMQGLVAMLPPEAMGGVADCFWREKDAIRGVFRISADEIRSVASIVSAGMAMAMSNTSCPGGVCTLDDDDSDPDDDKD